MMQRDRPADSTGLTRREQADAPHEFCVRKDAMDEIITMDDMATVYEITDALGIDR